MNAGKTNNPPAPPAPAKPIRVLIADDHYVVRQGLRAILENAGLVVLAEAKNGREAVELFGQHHPDVCILDARMPLLDGIEAAILILRADPQARIITLSSYEGDADIARALDAGAASYVLKSSLDERLPEVVRAVFRGERPLGRDIKRALAQHGPRSDLTERETEVLTLIARGRSNKEVAAVLNLSVSTVNNHVANILVRLDASDRTAAVTTALRRGLVRLD